MTLEDDLAKVIATHKPLGSTLPDYLAYKSTARAILASDVIAKVRAEEREKAARIAESWGFSQAERLDGQIIAARIREQGKEQGA